MRFYFQLQFVRICRFLREAGVHPLIATILIGFAFLFTSLLLFDKLESAPYVYAGLALLFLTPLTNSSRINFLLRVFDSMSFRVIRLIENTVFLIPFLMVLIWKEAFAIAGILLVVGCTFSLLTYAIGINIVLPTPFGKRPFEFPRGFRQMVLLFAIEYMLAIIAVVVGNFNLGVFSLVSIYLTSLSFYNLQEPLYFVWTHSCSAEAFLKAKLVSAIKYVTILALPVAIALVVMNPNGALVVVATLIIGPFYPVLGVFAKYAYYPSQVNIIPGISIALCMVIPPLIIFAIPFFYRQSLINLRPILL